MTVLVIDRTAMPEQHLIDSCHAILVILPCTHFTAPYQQWAMFFQLQNPLGNLKLSKKLQFSMLQQMVAPQSYSGA